MLAVLTEFERDQISERTRLALDHRSCREELVGYLTAIAWRLARDAGEQAAITLIRELGQVGAPLRAIARELEGRVYRAKSRMTRWHPQTVKKIKDEA